MAANDRQVGGEHYRRGGEQHWDRVDNLGLDYYQAQITKYVERCWEKGGVSDLEKARHFLDKYIELAKDRQSRVFKDRVLPTIAPLPKAWRAEQKADGRLIVDFRRTAKARQGKGVSGRKVRPVRKA